jgi:hypothetical protein
MYSVILSKALLTSQKLYSHANVPLGFPLKVNESASFLASKWMVLNHHFCGAIWHSKMPYCTRTGSIYPYDLNKLPQQMAAVMFNAFSKKTLRKLKVN